MYEVKLEQFSGPLDKLLELIETKQLEITQVSLAEVTVDFLEFIKTLGKNVPPGTIADFLVAAAKLVLLKSKVLLPDLELTEEEEGEIKDLETRLALYREFAARSGGASRELSQLWMRKEIAYSRPLLFTALEKGVFYPSPWLTPETLARAFNKAIAALEALTPEPGKVKGLIISLEGKIRELLTRFSEAVAHSFRNLTKDRSRSEVIVLFLAILHLLKERSISVEQSEQFGDILVRKSGTISKE